MPVRPENRTGRKRPALKNAEALQRHRDVYKPLTHRTKDELAASHVDAERLTPQAKNFIKLWAEGNTVHAAALKAGYVNTSYAYALAHTPTGMALYNEEKKKYEEVSEMTRKRVMDGLLDGIEMCKITGDGPGVITGWKTIGQMCGYFEPIKRKVELSVKGNVMLGRLNAMSDADLLKVIQEGVTHDLLALEAGEE